MRILRYAYLRAFPVAAGVLLTACQSPSAPSRDLTAIQQGTVVHLSIDMVVDSSDQRHWMRVADTIAAGLVLTPEGAGTFTGEVRYIGPALDPDSTGGARRLDDSFFISALNSMATVTTVIRSRSDSTLDLLSVDLQPSDNRLQWGLWHSHSGGELTFMAGGDGSFR